MYTYKWEKSFFISDKVSKSVIEVIFNILNKGTIYNNVDGEFVGYINFVDAPMGGIFITSDHSLSMDDCRFIIFRVFYLDQDVLYFKIIDDSIIISNFFNGHWANTLQRVSKNGLKFR